MSEKFQLVLICGVSGSGKSTALNALEDIGYSCTDNLPARLLPSFIQFVLEEDKGPQGLLINCHSADSFKYVEEVTEDLRGKNYEVHWLYFDAQDDVLLRRFKETRRPHPLLISKTNEVKTIAEALEQERSMLSAFRAAADRIIDTSFFSPHDLRRTVEEYFSFHNTLKLTLLSFGFKYGLPQDADLVVDVRFLPNPYFVEELRERNGLEEAVKRYVLEGEGARDFVDQYVNLLSFLLPKYRAEGKRNPNCRSRLHRRATSFCSPN